MIQNRCRRIPFAVFLLASTLMVPACQPRVMEETEVEPVETAEPSATPANDNRPSRPTEDKALGHHPLQDERLGGTLWMQTSSEFPALSRQAFALARLQLDRALADRTWTAALEQEPGTFAGKPPAIIVDVDETILDNSPFQGQMLLDDNRPFSSGMWDEWAAMGEAPPMAGAKEFLDYVASKGVEIFYVTNRAAHVEDGTRASLEAAELPVNEDFDTVLTKNERSGWVSDKQNRRAFVAETHRILLLMGDDMNDFVSVGQALDSETRVRVGDEHADRWGQSWIVLPNPVYGNWERSLFEKNYDLLPSEILGTKRGHLRGYREAQAADPPEPASTEAASGG